MPRHVISLSPDTYEFDDTPMIHENIWKAASNIANIPTNLKKLEMEVADREQEREMKGLQMQNMKDEMAARKAGAVRQAEKDRYDRESKEADRLLKMEDGLRKHHLEMKKIEAKKLTTETPSSKALSARERTAKLPPMVGADDAKRETRLQTQADANEIAKSEKARGAGKYAVDFKSALSAIPKTTGMLKKPVPEDVRLQQAREFSDKTYVPSLGDSLRSELGGSTLPPGNPKYRAMAPVMPELSENELPLDVGTPNVPLANVGAPTMATPAASAPRLTPEQRAAQVSARIDALPPERRGEATETMKALAQYDPDAYAALAQMHGFAPRQTTPQSAAPLNRGLYMQVGGP